jgi:chromosome segregation ATPase
LDRLIKDYEQLDAGMDFISVSLDRKKEVLPELKAELDDLEKKWEVMEQARNLETRVNELQAELIWSKIGDLEKVSLVNIRKEIWKNKKYKILITNSSKWM